MEVVELCKKYRHEGVVAIDLAGDESLNTKANPEHRDAYMVRVINYMLRNVCSYTQEITCLATVLLTVASSDWSMSAVCALQHQQRKLLLNTIVLLFYSILFYSILIFFILAVKSYQM